MENILPLKINRIAGEQAQDNGVATLRLSSLSKQKRGLILQEGERILASRQYSPLVFCVLISLIVLIVLTLERVFVLVVA